MAVYRNLKERQFEKAVVGSTFRSLAQDGNEDTPGRRRRRPADPRRSGRAVGS